MPRSHRLPAIGLLLAAVLMASGASAEVVVLRDNTRIEGQISQFGSITGPAGIGPDRKRSIGGPFVVVDDGLRRTLVPYGRMTRIDHSETNQAPERFRLRQSLAGRAGIVASLGPVIQATPFDEFGQRTLLTQGPRGPMPIVQGITEITPQTAKVQGLRAYWQSSIPTKSIPAATVVKLLHHHIDPKDRDDRMRIVRFLIQAEWYEEAQAELAAIVKDFPQEAATARTAKAMLVQSQAKQILDEIKLRERAGQPVLAQRLLQAFPVDGVQLPILVERRNLLQKLQLAQADTQRAIRTLGEQADSISAAEAGSELQPIIDQVTTLAGPDTLPRLQPFLAALDDAHLTPRDRVALAISSWVAGPESAKTGWDRALALWHARDRIVSYLVNPATRRAADLATLRQQSDLDPALAAKMIALLPPWLDDRDEPPDDPREQATAGDKAADDMLRTVIPESAIDPATNPRALKRMIRPVRLELTATAGDRAGLTYWVLLPPEYSPYRHYPLLIVLHGEGASPQRQLLWWAPQAARHGYILAAPEYLTDPDRQYRFTAAEHTRVLLTLRDARKRFAVDSNRIFLAGHSCGGEATWDIGLAHPDQFAGIVPISAAPRLYAQWYWRNAGQLPVYAVDGEKDGDNPAAILRWFSRAAPYAYPIRYVEYIGGGHDQFYAEVSRIFDWMEGKRRVVDPAKIECISARRTDNRFYWVGIDDFQPVAVIAPDNFGQAKVHPARVSAQVSALVNSIRIKVGGASSVTVWLTPWSKPSMLDFSQPIRITVNGQQRFRGKATPTLGQLLDDVRIRGDRDDPFPVRIDLDRHRGH